MTPVSDPLVRGPSVLPAITHKFDLLRADLVDKQNYADKLRVEANIANNEAVAAKLAMQNYLKEQGAI